MDGKTLADVAAVERPACWASLSMAFLVALETLSPDQRAVLILHDVFAYSHAELATMLERTTPHPGSCSAARVNGSCRT